MRGQNHIITPSEWDESGVSAVATLQVVTHSPGALKRSYLAGIAAQSSDNSRVAWNLDSPDGTLHVQGFTNDVPWQFDPPLELPEGADVRLEIAAGGAGVTTKGNTWGYDLDVVRPS